MPIASIPASEAYAKAAKNKLRRFPSPDKDGDRLYPLASPMVNPGFQFEKSDTFFAIGSCFARNVEAALANANLRVLSREFDLGKIGESVGQAFNFFNKYSVHSIYNELLWAFERKTFPGEDILYPLRQGKKYCDLQLGSAKLEFSPEEILEFRHKFLDSMAQVAHTDVIILTLGYVETWYDKELDIYLNIAPPAALCKAQPDRFEFRVLSYDEVIQGMNDIYALLKKHRTKPLKMLVTVSPVPLLSTFRDMDVLVANTYSKSVQRAALESFVADKPDVDYFPSYEFVILSNPTIAWSRGDYRHVSPDIVARIMSNVLTSYLPGQAAPEQSEQEILTPEALLSTARLYFKLEQDEKLVTLLDENPDIVANSVDLLLLKAAGHRRLGFLEDSFECQKAAIDLAPKRPAPLERQIKLCRPLRRNEVAKELLQLHKERFPGRGGFRNDLAWLK